jgi:hypothetical protein
MSDGLSGPHLAAAFLCEKVLQEPDQVPSFIRVVERFMVPVFPNPPQGMQIQQPAIQITLVVSLKAGSIPGGKYIVQVKLQKPDGSNAPDNNIPVFFNGSDDNGVLIAMQMIIPSPDEGLYWFDVYFEGAGLLTRIPMRVLHQAVALPFQPAQGH